MKNIFKGPMVQSVILAVALLSATGVAQAHEWQGQDGQGQHQMACGPQLPEAKVQLLHQTMKGVYEKDKALIDRMHSLHKELHEVMMADSFDQHKYITLKDQMETTRAKIEKDRTVAFASIAGQFTPEERKMLMRMRHHHMHGHHHHGDHNGDHQQHGWNHDGQQGGWHEGNNQGGMMPPADGAVNSPSYQQEHDGTYPPYAH